MYHVMSSCHVYMSCIYVMSSCHVVCTQGTHKLRTRKLSVPSAHKLRMIFCT